MSISPTRCPRSPSQRRRHRTLSPADTEQIQQAFRIFDANDSGVLRDRELKAALRAFGFEVKKTDVHRLLHDQGKSPDAPIDFETFCNVLSDSLLQRDPVDRVRQCFRLMDIDGTGKIHLRGLKRLCKEIGETIDETELQEMIDAFDSDADGLIDRDDFERILLGDSDSD